MQISNLINEANSINAPTNANYLNSNIFHLVDFNCKTLIISLMKLTPISGSCCLISTRNVFYFTLFRARFYVNQNDRTRNTYHKRFVNIIQTFKLNPD